MTCGNNVSPSWKHLFFYNSNLIFSKPLLINSVFVLLISCCRFLHEEFAQGPFDVCLFFVILVTTRCYPAVLLYFVTMVTIQRRTFFIESIYPWISFPFDIKPGCCMSVLCIHIDAVPVIISCISHFTVPFYSFSLRWSDMSLKVFLTCSWWTRGVNKPHSFAQTRLQSKTEQRLCFPQSWSMWRATTKICLMLIRTIVIFYLDANT